MNTMLRSESKNVKILSLLHRSVAVFMDQATVIPEKDDTATVIVTPRATYDKKTFLSIYADRVKNGTITLYKSVNPDTLCDFYTGKIKYEGVVTCPDWNPDTSIECGHGLHLSPEPFMALSYNNGKVLRCEVEIDDFVVYPHDIRKVRCRKVTVIEGVTP